MRTKLVVGNWKMNKTVAESLALVEAFVEQVDQQQEVDVVVCPPFISLFCVHSHIKNTHIKLGAQDCFWEDEGAFTGQVSPMHLSHLCADFCIVGHSETRGRFGGGEMSPELQSYFSESDASINRKIKALLFHAITPILCVGETQSERDSGQTEEVIAQQLSGALKGVDAAELFGVVVAYEPVWAIGTGNTCDAAEADRVCGFIRKKLSTLADELELADHARILYGGSVKPNNSDELFAQPNIDGALVGGASLDPDGFARIVMSA